MRKYVTPSWQFEEPPREANGLAITIALNSQLLLNKVNPEAFLNPDDATLEGVRSKVRFLLFALFGGSAYALHLDVGQLLGATLLSLGLITADQIGYGGGAWNLVIDTLGTIRLLSAQ